MNTFDYISALSNTLLAENSKYKLLLAEIWEETEGYADGAPDASEHDKLCNRISSRIREVIGKPDRSSDETGYASLRHNP